MEGAIVFANVINKIFASVTKKKKRGMEGANIFLASVIKEKYEPGFRIRIFLRIRIRIPGVKGG